MPRRSDIDPVDMPRRLLPFINLVDVVADERRYVYRLVGMGDVDVRGQDPEVDGVKDQRFLTACDSLVDVDFCTIMLSFFSYQEAQVCAHRAILRRSQRGRKP